MQTIATPYVKQYNENGQCTNPITLNNPYLHPESAKSRAERRGRLQYLPTGVNGLLQPWRKTATGKWCRA